MAEGDPKTLDEWRPYIAALDDEQLVAQARAANTASFVRQLQDEGLDASAIHGVLWLFAQRFKETGLRPPADGYLDLAELMEQAQPAP